METITKYRANDGSEWNDSTNAAKRDILHERVQRAMQNLGSRPTGLDRKEYVQHDPEIVLQAKDALFVVCRQEGLQKHFDCFKEQGRTFHSMSGIGRVLDGDGPIDRAWGRFAFIDDKGRECQQPYVAYIEGLGKDALCVEDRR